MERLAEGALTFGRVAALFDRTRERRPSGIVSWLPGGRPLAVMGFGVTRGKVAELDILANLARIGRLDLTMVEGN